MKDDYITMIDNFDNLHQISIKNLYQSCASTTGWGTLTATGDYPYITNDWKELTGYTIDPKYWEYNTPISKLDTLKNNKKGGDDDMRYLYEVILVNPKYDTFHKKCTVAKSETSALMKIYNESPFNKDCEGVKWDCIDFDDLKTSCRVLMEWKKEKSLKKAIETIKKAVE